MTEVSSEVWHIYEALADGHRLKMLGLLTWQELSILELAARLDMRPTRVRHHLERLQAVGVISVFSQGSRRLYVCDPAVLRDAFFQLYPGKALTPAHDFKGGAWERKVLQMVQVFECASERTLSASQCGVVWVGTRTNAVFRCPFQLNFV